MPESGKNIHISRKRVPGVHWSCETIVGLLFRNADPTVSTTRFLLLMFETISVSMHALEPLTLVSTHVLNSHKRAFRRQAIIALCHVSVIVY